MKFILVVCCILLATTHSAAQEDIASEAEVAAETTLPPTTVPVSDEVETTGLAGTSSCPMYTTLRPDYYQATCPQFLNVVKAKTDQAIALDPVLIAGLLRLHFHDCFIGGCEASLLLDISSDPTTPVEKLSSSNDNMRVAVFKLVDDIKAALDATSTGCQDSVSCADIITATTWHALNRAIPAPPVPSPPLLGRKDGTVSSSAAATAGLPSTTSAAADLVRLFAAKCITKDDLAVLVGSHSVGRVACEYVADRLNIPSVVPQSRARMVAAGPVCGLVATNPITGANYTSMQMTRFFMTMPWRQLQSMGIRSTIEANLVASDKDTVNSATFDAGYYNRLRRLGEAWLPSDYTLAENPATFASMANAAAGFTTKFRQSWQKLSTLKGTEAGEVRRRCRCPNSVSADACQAAKAQTRY